LYETAEKVESFRDGSGLPACGFCSCWPVLYSPLDGLRSQKPIKGVMVIASESAGFKKVLSAGVVLQVFLSSLV